MPLVEFKKLVQNARMPKYTNEHAMGFDLFAPEGIAATIIPAGQMVSVKLGFATAIEEGFGVDIRPRSGHALKGEVTIMNAPGTVDEDYRGEWILLMKNHSNKDYIIPNDKAVAQGVVKRRYTAHFNEVNELPDSSRGKGGFGSTDNKTDNQTNHKNDSLMNKCFPIHNPF